MLGLKDARGQGIYGVRVQHGHRLLQHDGARVEALVHQVHGGAAHLHPVPPGLTLGVQAGKGGQQRRVHVQDAAREGADEDGGEEPHVAGQAHEVDAVLCEKGRQHARRSPRAAGSDDRAPRRVSPPARRARGRGVGHVGDHHGKLSPELPASRRVDEGLQVGSAAADEHAELHGRDAGVTRKRRPARGPPSR